VQSLLALHPEIELPMIRQTYVYSLCYKNVTTSDKNVPRVCMGTKVRHKSIHGVLEDRALDSKCISPCRFFLLAIPSVATMGVCRN
jgi:hypothetical protein